MDTVDFSRFIFAFIFVLGLIGLMAYCLKRYNGARILSGKKLFGVGNENGRIQVKEVRYIDAKRRLVLIERDDVEHLLLLSDRGELVIESGIRTTMMPSDAKTHE